MMRNIPVEYRGLIPPYDLPRKIQLGFLRGTLVLLALYLQQVDVSLIYIKKWLITKQQDQLNSYFMSQNDAVVLYNNEVVQTPAGETQRGAECQVNCKPIIQLFNPAFKNMTGIELSVDKSSQSQDQFANIQNDDLESKIFLVKTSKNEQNVSLEPLISTSTDFVHPHDQLQKQEKDWVSIRHLMINSSKLPHSFNAKLRQASG